jgi:hypothetical protein
MEGFSGHPAPIVTAIAVAAPLLAELPIGVRLPAMVLEMILPRQARPNASAGSHEQYPIKEALYSCRRPDGPHH